MLKALKTLLKGDIIKETNMGGGSMSNERYELRDVHILMWMAVLNNFKDPDCPNDTFDDKMKKFVYRTANIEINDLQHLLEKMIDDNLIDLSTEKCILTVKGRTLMKALGTMYKLPDEKVMDIVEVTTSIFHFAEEHLSDIISIILTTRG